MCDERMTTVHGHLVNEAFQEEEWKDLILLNGLDRLTEPDDDFGTLLPFDDFYRDFVDDVNSEYMDDLTVTSVSDDDSTTSLSESDLCEPGTHVRKWFRQGWFDGTIHSVDLDQQKCHILYSDGDSEDMFFEDPEIDIIVQNSGDALVSLVPEGNRNRSKKKKLRNTHNTFSVCNFDPPHITLF